MKLGLFIIQYHHKGYADEMIFLPSCNRCGQPIIDFNSANLVVEAVDPQRLQPAGIIYGLPLWYQPGAGQGLSLSLR